MKQKSLPSTLLLYFFRLIPLRFCNFCAGASRREVLFSLPLLVLWYGILYAIVLCFQATLPGFIPPANIPYILLLLIQIPLAALIFRWWNVLEIVNKYVVGRVDSYFIPVAANVALTATILCAWLGNKDYALYAAFACAVMFIPIALKLRRDMSDAVSTCLGKDCGNDPKFTLIMLEGGADPNASTARNSDGLTPLQEQVWRAVNDYYGADESCKLLLSYGADPNVKSKGGSTPLIRAVLWGKKWLCWLLLTHGANPNAKNGDIPLHNAASIGKEEICKLLLKHGADLNARDEWLGDTPLHKAPFNGKEEVCKLLLTKGADPNARNESGNTPLHNAAACGNVAACQVLLKHGADLNARNESGNTPLHRAAYRGMEAVCQVLLDHGADLNARNEDGYTPLHIAAKKREPEVFKLLLRRGATLEKGTLFLAAKGASAEIYKICLAHGNDPNMMLDYGRTPLHALFADGYRGELESCCRLLLDHDANPNARTTARFQDLSAGSTPLHLVAQKLNKALRKSCEEDEEGWRSVYNMLLSAGADPNLANEDGLTPDMIVKGRSAPQKSSQK